MIVEGVASHFEGGCEAAIETSLRPRYFNRKAADDI
jgi:hypothetical protein